MAWISDNYSAKFSKIHSPKFSKIHSHFFKNISENFRLQIVNWNAETHVLLKQKFY